MKHQQDNDFLHRVKAAARGHWLNIHRRLGIPEHLLNTRKHCPCPYCGGHDRYRYTDHEQNGGYICNQCGNGSGFDLLMLIHRYDFKDALQDVAGVLGMSRETPQPRCYAPLSPEQRQDRLPLIERLWNEAQPLQGSLALQYLRNRGLNISDSEAEKLSQRLRFHARMKLYGEDGKLLGRYLAMLGIITNTKGSIKGLHRTYLNEQGQKLTTAKGEPIEAKKMLSRYPSATTGAAIALYPAAEVLGIGEGIETTLAGREIIAMHTGETIPVHAALSAGGIARFEIPDCVRHLFIFTDNDRSQAGQKATAALAKRAKKIIITQLQPPTIGTDALDYLQQSKGAAYE